MRRTLILLLLMAAGQGQAAEITLVPGDALHLNVTNPGKAYTDLVVHSILVTTGPDETINVSGLQIDLVSEGRVVVSKSIAPERLVGETQGIAQMVAQGLRAFLDAQILSKEGIEGLFGRKLNFADSSVLGPNEALVLARQHFSVDFVPDELRVTVQGTGESGADKTVSEGIGVEPYQSPISYAVPLRGAWLMTSLPSIQSHHRLNPPTEFAVDFFKINAEGRIHDGDVLDADSFFGYGAEVLAAADGEVVFVISDQVQDRAAYLPKSGENPQQTGARIRYYNMRRYADDFARAAAGNIVTIRHQGDGTTEFSSYGHLKADGVKVKVGDVVKAGQVIAEVGDTGDSAAVHLHFQINAGPDPFFSKSLPVEFSDIERTLRGIDPGQFVRKVE